MSDKRFRLIRAAELAEMLSVSPGTIWRMEKEGRLPAKVKLSPGTVGWIESEIIEFIHSKKIG